MITLWYQFFEMQTLANYLRPASLESFVGQKHITQKDKIIPQVLESWNMFSMLFWWPPGTGKTTLANIISNKLEAEFYELSGVYSKKKDLKQIIQKAKKNEKYNTKTVVFLDEIHRWNKAQQDYLLPFLEDKTIVLIWASTENPSYRLQNALLSRLRVFEFMRLEASDIQKFIQTHIDQIAIFFDVESIDIDPKALELLANNGNGDLRVVLNSLENILYAYKDKQITPKLVSENISEIRYYDQNDENHYNLISAFIKSIRDSNVDASCYRLQRMLDGWEDPLFIARRMIISASEDIGTSNHNALLIANQVYEAAQKVWLPEAKFALFHGVIYLANSDKSYEVYKYIKKTKQDVQEHGNLPVPKHLRNANSALEKQKWYGKGYKYAHDYENSQVEQQHFPDKLKGRKY